VTKADLLLVDGTIVTLDDACPLLERGSLAVQGERILAVGESGSWHGPATRTIDCRGKLLLPGLVDAHTHLFQGFARGLGEGMNGWAWLADFMWHYAGAISHDDSVVAAYLGAMEVARAGTTALLDHHYGQAGVETTLAVAEAIEHVGLRGIVARGIAGPLSEIGAKQGLPASSFKLTAAEELALTRACMEAKPPGGRVAVWPGPINVVYTERELLRDAVELAREFGARWHTHFCAPSRDPEIYSEHYGQRPAAWLDRERLLDGDATLAHCTWLDDGDVELIGGNCAGVVHCPVSNQYMPYGVMRLRDLRRAGATIALGSDGPACGHRQDMFLQLKQTILLQRGHSLDPEAVQAEEALELATVEGARLLGIDAGRLAPGMLADVTIVDVTAPHLVPLLRPAASLAYAAAGQDVWMTIVGGEVIVEDGRCTRVDEDAIVEEARARAEHLIRRAGLDRLRRLGGVG
jgi:5-methylthioadenosine/S-adenosylhomocysteine deaminase